MKEFNFKKKTEWYIRNDRYVIDVVTWQQPLSGWIWNIYVNILRQGNVEYNVKYKSDHSII